MRFKPAGAMRIFSLKWLWEPYPEYARLTLPFTDLEYPGSKYLRGVDVEADTRDYAGVAQTVNMLLQVDGSTATVDTLVLDTTTFASSRTRKAFALTNPAVVQTARLVPSANVRIFNIRWIYDKYPELAEIRTEWDSAGTPGAKFLYGLELELDTKNLAKTLTVEYDLQSGAGGGTGSAIAVAQSIPSQLHNDRTTITYSLTTPVIAHHMRIVPAVTVPATNAMRIFSVKWIFEPWPEFAQLVPPFTDIGHPGPKYLRGLDIEADTNDLTGAAQSVNVQIQIDGSVTPIQTLVLSHAGRQRLPYAITAPRTASEVRLVPQGSLRLFDVNWIYDKYPEISTISTEWTNDGDIGAKFLQGFVLDCDTGAGAATIRVDIDDNVAGATVAIGATTERSERAFVFNPPLRTHNMRLFPLTGNVRIFGVRWDWQSDSELVSYYEAQETSFDLPGWKHVRELYVAYSSATAPLTLALYADGVAIAGIPTLPISSGYVRTRILIPATKFKALRATLTSTANFRLYSRDCSIYVKPWGSAGDYAIAQLFGTRHRDRGVAVI